MRKLILLSLCAALAATAMAVPRTSSLERDSQWLEFKRTHNKVYANHKEEMLRRQLFEENKKFIDEFNTRGDSTFKLGVNHLADWTREERKRLNGLRVDKSSLSLRQSKENRRLLEREVPGLASSTRPIPAHFDWRDDANVVSPVKDQGQCGSCWAFSVTGVLEGNQKRLGMKKLVELSEQNLLDCSRGENLGCNGGYTDKAMLTVRDEGGIESEKDYPYKVEQGKTCKFNPSKAAFKASGVVSLAQGDELELATVVALHSPVSVGIDASSMEFQFYESGVYNANCTKDIDHAVLVVGYGHDKKGGDYWIVKNSWNAGWGEDGYIKMVRNNHSQCAIADYAMIPIFL